MKITIFSVSTTLLMLVASATNVFGQSAGAPTCTITTEVAECFVFGTDTTCEDLESIVPPSGCGNVTFALQYLVTNTANNSIRITSFQGSTTDVTKLGPELVSTVSPNPLLPGTTVNVSQILTNINACPGLNSDTNIELSSNVKGQAPNAINNVICGAFEALDIHTSPYPTQSPSQSPSMSPTMMPTPFPTPLPTPAPTNAPTANPTRSPTSAPTGSPTDPPTVSPTKSPTPPPTASPTKSPTPPPTASPTTSPTASPTSSPTKQPTNQPTKQPTPAPTPAPTSPPTANPTLPPTLPPTRRPSFSPTGSPTDVIVVATLRPTPIYLPPPPTYKPTKKPTRKPTKKPTAPPCPSGSKVTYTSRYYPCSPACNVYSSVGSFAIPGCGCGCYLA